MVFCILVLNVLMWTAFEITSAAITLAEYRRHSFKGSIDFEGLAKLHPDLNITGFPVDIVPNYVHFILYDNHEVSFTAYLGIMSVLVNHKPKRLYVHCDCDTLTGPYWDLIMKSNLSHVVKVNKIIRPRTIFGVRLAQVYHASDVARALVLMTYGGIYLDTDCLVFKSMAPLFKFEMTLSMETKDNLGSQVLIAHKNARFVEKFFQLYKKYDPKQWIYNSAILPTNEVLRHDGHMTNLAHYELEDINVKLSMIRYLYAENHPESEWSQFYAVHTLVQQLKNKDVMDEQFWATAPCQFDLNNIKSYNRTYGAMARKLIFGTIEIMAAERDNSCDLEKWLGKRSTY